MEGYILEIVFNKIDEGENKNNLKKFFAILQTIYLDWRRFEQLYVIEECEAKYIAAQYPSNYFFFDLMRIMHEHLIQKICTLHDPDNSRNHKNICLKRIVNITKELDDSEFIEEVNSVGKELEEIFAKTNMKEYRNKYIAHNDVDGNDDLKEIFNSEDINNYFETLKKLCNLIHKKFNDEKNYNNEFIDSVWLNTRLTIKDVINVTEHIKKLRVN